MAQSPKNRYGRAGIPANWEAIKTIWVSGTKTADQIGAIFGIKGHTIAQRALKQNWHALRAQLRASKDPLELVKSETVLVNKTNEADTLNDPNRIQEKTNAQATTSRDEATLQRAKVIASSDTFRARVIKANETALDVLEKNPPQTVNDCDHFAEALTKVERIGARTYGYDRESEQPIVNIGLLNSGSDYELP